MRVMMIHPGPSFSVADVHRGLLKGLREHGCQVIDFNLDDRLSFYANAGQMREGEFVLNFDSQGAARLAAKGIEAACYEYLPQVLVVTSCFYVPLDILDLIRARRTKVVIVHTEEPYEHDRQLRRAAHADLNLLNDPTNLEAFRAVQPNSHYMPHAYDPDVHTPGPAAPKLASDFCFVGTGYQSRIDFLEAVDWSGIDVALAGNWGQLDEDSPLRPFVAHGLDECVDNADAINLYRSTKASANLYRREAERPELEAGWACGPREIELAATGTFFLREPRGEGDELFPMVPSFEGPEDFGDKLRWWLAHPDKRQEVVAAARAAVVDRTFSRNAERLLSLLGT